MAERKTARKVGSTMRVSCEDGSTEVWRLTHVSHPVDERTMLEHELVELEEPDNFDEIRAARAARKKEIQERLEELDGNNL